MLVIGAIWTVCAFTLIYSAAPGSAVWINSASGGLLTATALMSIVKDTPLSPRWAEIFTWITAATFIGSAAAPAFTDADYTKAAAITALALGSLLAALVGRVIALAWIRKRCAFCRTGTTPPCITCHR